jgi:carbonic anhydrase
MSLRIKAFTFVALSALTLVCANEPAHKQAPAASAPKAKAATPPAGTAAPAAHSQEPEKVAADEALKRLIAGNQRYVNSTMAHPNQTGERRGDVAQSQKPFAIIVSCSDSRVPPEVLFDQGVGDLFVIRSAGQVVTEVGIGSIEYAVEHLGSPLIMVLGHERCGAVKATADGGEAPGSIGSICGLIKPAVDKAKAQGGGDLVDQAVRNNVANVADKIAASPLIRKALASGEVKIVRGYYDLDDGQVKPLP